jgi:hypothetical protein
MYDQYATLMRVADAGYLSGNHRLAAARTHRVARTSGSRRGLTHRRHGNTQTAAAQSRGSMRPACAGVDATAR